MPNTVYENMKRGPPEKNLSIIPLEAKFINIPLEVYELDNDGLPIYNRPKMFAQGPIFLYFVKDID